MTDEHQLAVLRAFDTFTKEMSLRLTFGRTARDEFYVQVAENNKLHAYFLPLSIAKEGVFGGTTVAAFGSTPDDAVINLRERFKNTENDGNCLLIGKKSGKNWNISAYQQTPMGPRIVFESP